MSSPPKMVELPENITNKNNNSEVESDYAEDENATCYSVSNEVEHFNGILDVDSSDFVNEILDIEREMPSNQPDRGASEEFTSTENNYASSETSIPTITNEFHSIEIHSDTQLKQTEHTNEWQDDGTYDKDTVVKNANFAEDDEPIFDFLGKSNEIVCYYCKRTSRKLLN